MHLSAAEVNLDLFLWYMILKFNEIVVCVLLVDRISRSLEDYESKHECSGIYTVSREIIRLRSRTRTRAYEYYHC